MFQCGVLFAFLGVADSASWAMASYNDGATCAGARKATAGDDAFPMLLDSCVLQYSGSPEKSKWVYVKSACSDTAVTRSGFSDDKCTVLATEKGFNSAWNRSCSAGGRSITCGTHDVAIAKSFLIPPGGDASKCVDGYHIGDWTFAIGACHTRLASSGSYVGMKAACGSGKVVMSTYPALDCSGTGTEMFTVSDACAAGYNANAWLMLKSGCGKAMGSGTSGSSSLAAKLEGSMRLMFIILFGRTITQSFSDL